MSASNKQLAKTLNNIVFISHIEISFLGVRLIYISKFSELIVTWLPSLTQPTNITVVNTTNQQNSVTEFFTILGFMHLKLTSF